MYIRRLVLLRAKMINTFIHMRQVPAIFTYTITCQGVYSYIVVLPSVYYALVNNGYALQQNLFTEAGAE